MKRTLILLTSESTPFASIGKDSDGLTTSSGTHNINTNEVAPLLRPLKKARRTSSEFEENACPAKKHQGPLSSPSSLHPLSAVESYVQLLQRQARMHRCQQNFEEARTILEKIVALQASGSHALMESLTELGSLCFDLRDFEASMNYHNVALNIYLDRQCEACFAGIAIVNLRHVAAIYLRYGNHRAALMCYNFIYKIQQTAVVDCPIEDLASTLSCIGLMNYLMEEYETALSFYQDELRLRVQMHHGKMDHEDIAVALNSIGIVFFQLDDFDAARQAFQSCLVIRQQILADNSDALLVCRDGRSNSYCFDLAMNYFNLAAIAMKQGDEREACWLYRRSMELKKAVFGDHPEIAVDYQYLGQLFLDHGDSQASVEYYTEAYKVVQVLSGRAGKQGGDNGQALAAARKLLVIIGNIHLLEANIDGMMEHFQEAARMCNEDEDFMDTVRVFGCQMYSINRMHPPCAAEA